MRRDDREMSRSARIGIIVLGLVAILGGLFAWSIEDSYGSGLNYSLEPRDGRTHVYEEQAGEEPVFIGSRDEAFEYMEQKRAGGESFVLPGAIIATGATLVIGGAFAVRRSKRTA